ncbi:hypothetical protein RDABS01_039151 [Bienertia sinuspersici]
MGSCVSSLQSQNSGSAKVDQMSSSVEKSSMPPTPVKDNTQTKFGETPTVSFAYKSRVSPFNSVSSNRNSISSNRSFGGSKDEAFYDTQAWLDSDCEDDFYSVNGDFTPSRSSTPVHHAAGTPRLSRVFSPQVNRAVFEGKIPIRNASNRSRGGTPLRGSFSSTQPIGADVDSPNPIQSSTAKKSKKLLDLFKESMRERGNIDLAIPPLPPKSASRGSSGLRYSVSSSIDNDNPVVDDKPPKLAHRCFPRLARSRTFDATKKTSDSPVPTTSLDDSKA